MRGLSEGGKRERSVKMGEKIEERGEREKERRGGKFCRVGDGQ